MGGSKVEIKARYEAWLNDPLIDEKTKAELKGLEHNSDELADRFFSWLEFGTGGLRGKIGAGTNRMNVYTVRLATQALANMLHEQKLAHQGVAIAYDSRNMSREFAETAAQVLVGNEIPVFIFSAIAPTPLLSFAVRHHQTGAGLVITASHNPPEYNGYKAYNSRGIQMLPDEAALISQQMASLTLEDVKWLTNAEESSLWHEIGDETITAYYDRVLEIAPEIDPGDLRVLYTPLHGTGGRFVPEILERAGFKRVKTVAAQMVPDGSFPTVSQPNPEEAGAFALAMEEAQAEPCDLILATDPDADRVGVAVWEKDNWQLLNGNQVGILLADFILSRMAPEELKGAVLVKTIVTTEMILPIAKKYNVEVYNTLTGFKYIGSLMDQLPEEGKHFVFGFEESYGYLAGTAVRDKDAVLTSLLVAQMAALYKKEGKTLVQRLHELMEEHGFYYESLVSYAFSGSAEAQRAREFIADLREKPLREIGGEAVEVVRDYKKSVELNLADGTQKPINLPMEDVIQWLTKDGSKITVRPSGTEPKMKLYFGVCTDSVESAKERLRVLEKAFDGLIKQRLQ